MWLSRLGVGALLIRSSIRAGLSIKLRHASLWLYPTMTGDCPQSQKIDLGAPDFGLGFCSPDDR